MVWWHSFWFINQPLCSSPSGSTNLRIPQLCRRVPFAPGCIQDFPLGNLFMMTLLAAVRGNLVAVLICLPVIIGDIELVSLCFLWEQDWGERWVSGCGGCGVGPGSPGSGPLPVSARTDLLSCVRICSSVKTFCSKNGFCFKKQKQHENQVKVSFTKCYRRHWAVWTARR